MVVGRSPKPRSWGSIPYSGANKIIIMKKRKLKVTRLKDMTADQLYAYLKVQEKNLEEATSTMAERFYNEFIWKIRKELAERFKIRKRSAKT